MIISDTNSYHPTGSRKGFCHTVVTVQMTIRLLVLLLVTLPSIAQTTNFCDLLRQPEKYNGKVVKVRATYRYAFESSQLYCLDCSDKGKAWLNIPTDLDDLTEKLVEKMPKGAGIVNLTVEGVFEFGSTYGHLNGYRYQIRAQRIRDIAVIQKGMKDAALEKKAEEQWACGGTNPK